MLSTLPTRVSVEVKATQLISEGNRRQKSIKYIFSYRFLSFSPVDSSSIERQCQCFLGVLFIPTEWLSEWDASTTADRYDNNMMIFEYLEIFYTLCSSLAKAITELLSRLSGCHFAKGIRKRRHWRCSFFGRMIKIHFETIFACQLIKISLAAWVECKSNHIGEGKASHPINGGNVVIKMCRIFLKYCVTKHAISFMINFYQLFIYTGLPSLEKSLLHYSWLSPR